MSDVTHLRDVYLALAADLGRRGRTDWVDEEMEVLTSPDTYRVEPEHAWQRLKTRVRKPKELAVLMEVAAWREREAQARDVPRAPRAQGRGHRRHRRAGADHDGAARRRCARCPRASSARNGAKTFSRRCSAGSRAIRRRCRGSSGRRPAPNGAATVELLKVLLRMTAERHGVAAKVIATVDDLEQHRRRRRGRRAGAERLAARAVRREGAWRSSTASLALAVERSRVVAVERD